jgi:transposase-like protein
MENTDQPSTRGAQRRRCTKAERSAHLEAWRDSGLSAQSYAGRHGLSAANLYAWSSKARRRNATAEQKQTPTFVPVRLGASAPGPDSGLRVALRSGGLECVVEGATDLDALAALAGALKREVFDV